MRTDVDDAFAALAQRRERRSRRAGVASDNDKAGEPRTRVDGPFERRILPTMRLCVTGLLPPEIDALAIRPTLSGFVVSSDIASGPDVRIYDHARGRELWLRGSKEVRACIAPALHPRRDASGRSRSVAVELYRRVLPGHVVELEVVARGGERSLW